jgi:site-specific recombinase XerD
MHDLSYLTRQYYQHHQSIQSRKNTLRWHRQAHQHFFKTCNIATIDDLTRDKIRYFIYLKSQEGKSAETIRSYVRSIKAFYRWLLEEEYVENNIFQKKIHLPSVDERPLKLISRVDLRKIKNMIEAYPYYNDMLERLRTKALFALYMNTGMRKSEALDVKMEHVKLKERIVFIEKTKTRDCRNVVINDDLYNELLEYCEYLKEKGIKSHYLFSLSNPKLPMSDDALRNIKEKIETFGRRRYKIKKFTLNMFRHTYISYGIADGLSIPFIMNQVGHVQMTTTQRYTHSPQKEMIQQLSRYSILRPAYGSGL